MQEILKIIVVFIITVAAKIFLWKHKPEIIAVTGSAGKTTTKEFLRELLEIDYEVIAPSEGYNTEIGAPLSLFGEKSPQKVTSFLEWLKIILRVYKKALFTKFYPDIIVIEMGADKPGDIKHLAKVFPPTKGIVLSVLSTHLEEFKTVEYVAKEKSELVKGVSATGKIYLNADDDNVKEMAKLAKGRVIFFGTTASGGYVAEDLASDIKGLRFTLKAGNKRYYMAAPLFGKHMIYPLMAAIAVARSMHISMDKIRKRVKTLKPFKGRMNIIEGRGGSIIIDDSYNANPDSMVLALEFLADNEGRKIALLGSMNELGDTEEEAHRKVGKKTAEVADILVTVGGPAQNYLSEEAKKAGLQDVHPFNTSKEAGEYVAQILRKGDIVLAKGSQNKVRMEKAVELIMAHPEKKEEVLVRQSAFWKERN